MSFAVRLEDLHKDYDLGEEVVRVLKGINLDVPEGDYMAIMGTSGSGKSTLLNVLGCLDLPSSGNYFLGDKDIGQLDDDQLSAIRASHIGFVFQSYNLIPQLTVLENIEAPLYYQGHISAEDHQRCLDLADQVGLSDRLKHRPQQLSGGQQQRAGIARSLVNNPRFILADEPTGNLDTATTEEILDLLDRLNESGKTIIMVTHEEEVARRARRIIRLKDGAIQSDTLLRPVEERVGEEESRDTAPTWNGLVAMFAVIALQLRALKLGVKSLQLHPMRSLLTVLGIFIGVASVIWLLAIGEGISAKAQQQIAELGATNILLETDRPPADPNDQRFYSFGVTLADYEKLIEAVPSIEHASPTRERDRMELKYGPSIMYGRLVGCTPAYQQLNHLEEARGHFISKIELDMSRKVCVLAAETAQKLFAYEDPLGKSVSINQDYYRVIGVMKSRTPSSKVGGAIESQDYAKDIYIPITTYWESVNDFFAHSLEGVPITTRVTLKVRDQSEVLETAEIVRASLTKWHRKDDFEMTVPLELLEQARSTRIMFMVMMGLIAAISLVVGGIGIMNIMLATVTERTREIGIRRALGARRWDISRQFLIETVLLSIVGGITGILGGFTCGPIFVGVRAFVESTFPDLMQSIPESIQSVTPTVVPWSIPVAFGISMSVGVIFGLYPANRASAMKPIEALRHVA